MHSNAFLLDLKVATVCPINAHSLLFSVTPRLLMAATIAMGSPARLEYQRPWGPSKRPRGLCSNGAVLHYSLLSNNACRVSFLELALCTRI